MVRAGDIGLGGGPRQDKFARLPSRVVKLFFSTRTTCDSNKKSESILSISLWDHIDFLGRRTACSIFVQEQMLTSVQIINPML